MVRMSARNHSLAMKKHPKKHHPITRKKAHKKQLSPVSKKNPEVIAENKKLGKDFEVLTVKPYKIPKFKIFLILFFCGLTGLLVFAKKIPLLADNWEFLIQPENIKLFLLILIVPFILGVRIYFDYRIHNHLKLKLS